MQTRDVLCWIGCALGVAWGLSAAPLRAEAPYAIYMMKPDGTQARKLAQVDDHTDHGSPRWSRDGKRVAFDALDIKAGAYDLFIINADGSGLKKVGTGRRADWSPDDKQLAVDVNHEIYVQNVDGQGRDHVAAGECPRWSPDGSQMALVEGRMLHVVDMVSGQHRALFEQPFALMYSNCCWSPDGRNIAVVVQPLQGPRRQLLFVNARGAEHGLNARVQTDGGMSGGASYSPDGKRLAYSAAYLIVVVDVEGSKRPQILPDQKGKNFEPDWSPDGQWLVFISNRE